MSCVAVAFKKLGLQASTIARQRACKKLVSPGLGSLAQRYISRSAILRDSLDLGQTIDEDTPQVPRTRKSPDRPTNRASLHVSGVHPETTDAEFREAFSVLPGLIETQLVFNSGPLRNYQGTENRGFGFLHFENEDAAKAAAKHMQTAPIRFRGYATEINPYRAVVPPPNQPTHVIYLNGVPLDLQYLEVMELLKEKCPDYKSIRFMAGKPGAFLGVATVAFPDTLAATRAKKALHGSTLGGTLLREHNVVYGRPLYDKRPTNTVMILGTPKDPEGAFEFRQELGGFDFVERYRLVKDRDTQEYRGFAIVGCKSVDGAWQLIEWVNRNYPSYRVTFILNRREYESQQGRDKESGRNRGNKLRTHAELNGE